MDNANGGKTPIAISQNLTHYIWKAVARKLILFGLIIRK